MRTKQGSTVSNEVKSCRNTKKMRKGIEKSTKTKAPRTKAGAAMNRKSVLDAAKGSCIGVDIKANGGCSIQKETCTSAKKTRDSINFKPPIL
jgi:hypothetical protein